MYVLHVTKSAKKNLALLPEKQRLRVVKALDDLEKNPFIGKKLKGYLNGLHSLKVWPFRIIYEIRKRELVVLVVRIGDRKDVYM